jgi:hypothetical protein
MPRAVPLARREQIIAFRQAGKPLVEIASQLGMPYRTLREIWRRFRNQGRDSLPTRYDRCGRKGVRHDERLLAAAQLADGSGTSLLAATDEASGALLGVTVFPPLSLEAGADGTGASGDARPL